MQLFLNGQPKLMLAEGSVRDLVVSLGFGDRAVAVEVNQKVVPRRDHERTVLCDGDRVEIVTLVGGG
jgi:sulfur carrier protein